MALCCDYNQTSNAKEAYEKASVVITADYVKSFKVKAEIDRDDDEMTITATGKGFTLSLEFTDEGCEVYLKLSLLLKALKSKILSEVKQKLEREL